MADQPSQKTSGKKPDELNSDLIDTMWREAILIRDISRDEIESAQRRREEAEKARLEAEREAIEVTEAMCANLRHQAEAELEEAHKVLSHARELEDQIQAKLDEAVSIKEQAEQGTSETLRRANEESLMETKAARTARIMSEEQAAGTLAEAGELLARTRTEAESTAKRIAAEANASAKRISVNADAELQRMRSDLEAARAAAFRELETQRTLTDTMRDRMATQIVAAESTGNEPIAEPRPAKKSKTHAKRAKPRSKKAAANTMGASTPMPVEVPEPATPTVEVEEAQTKPGEMEDSARPDNPAVEVNESAVDTEAA
jgi:hypothetical protein